MCDVATNVLDRRRDATGHKPTQFRKGNPGGPGNPFTRQTHQLQAALMAAVTKEDVRDIAMALIDKAKGGDVAAVHELFNRLFGKAKQSVDVAVEGQISFTLNIGNAGPAEPSEN